MKTIPPTQPLEPHLQQSGITTAPGKLKLFKRALALRGTPPLRAQENAEDPTVFVKLFDPCGNWTIFILEWDTQELTFGFTIGHEPEFGYVDLAELAGISGPLGIGFEVDAWFLPQPLSKAVQAWGLN
ncbi:MAG: DUF2958 domain-containing protein [Verrucomicrobia bacterium]|nr:DUF2958 domain-containing protein [Verrucomicrobiota bacterium]